MRAGDGVWRADSARPAGEESRLPPKVLAHFAGLVENVSVRLDSPGDLRGAEEAFQRVREGLAAGRVVELDYRAADGRRSLRRVHPQRLVLGPLGLYLIGHDEARGGELRTFRLERVLAARCTNLPAERDPAFDPDDYLAGSLGIRSPEHPPKRFRVRLHSERAVRYLRENPWHAGQRWVRRRDGGFDLDLELTSARELLPRVLALGPEAELIEPAEARGELAELLRRAALRYPGPGTRKPRAPRS